MRQPFGQTLIAGDVWSWTLRLEDRNLQTSAGVTLKYFLRGPGSQALDLDSTLTADQAFSFTATSEQTLALNPSGGLPVELSWQLCLFDASNNRTELARGTVTILPDLAGATGGIDARSWVKQALDAVQAVIQGRASRVEKEYQIAGRHVGLLSPAELLELEGDLQAKYDRELIANGQSSGRGTQIQAAFGPRQTGAGVWK